MTTALIIVGALVLIVWASRFFAFYRERRTAPFVVAVSGAKPPEPAPFVSILVPVRNESRNVARCLDSILSQDYPGFEVLVVDDRSDDDTAAIVRDYAGRDARVRFIESETLPEGWTGKNYALHRAAREAKGDVLVFLDADVALDPGALTALVRRLVDDRADLLSLFLRLDSTSFWEKTVRVLAGAILTVRYPVRRVNDPRRPEAFANGQILIFRAEAYRAIGGHEAVREALLEDVAFAHHVKESGRRLVVGYGFDAAAVRMYPTFSDIWRGWTRIYYSGYRAEPARLGLSAVALAIFSLLPYATLLWTAAEVAMGPAPAATWVLFALSAAELAVMLALMAKLHTLSRSGAGWTLFNLPAGLLCFALLWAAMLRCFMPGTIVWKETRYDADRHA